MIIEVRTFRLSGDEKSFLDADRAEQHALCVRNRGVIRRTTARGEDGEWVVLTLWDSHEAIEGPGAELAALVDAISVEVRLYEDIGG